MGNMMGGNNRGMGGLGNMGRMMVSPSQKSCNIFWIIIYLIIK